MTSPVPQPAPSPATSATSWRSAPQPHASAVVNLYLDSRDSDGNPQLIERFYLEPVTSGVPFNLYYSPAPPPAGTIFPALDDPLRPDLLAPGGTTFPDISDVGIVFPGSPGWLTVANQAAGTTAESPWWAGIEIMPTFASGDPGAYMIADAGLVQLSYAAGRWAVTLTGGALLATWSFDFVVGQRLQFIVGFDGSSFFAWSPLGQLFQVPAAPPIPPAAQFRFGAPLPGTYDQQVTALSPAAWWTLGDESQSNVAVDDSRHGFNGTATNVAFGSDAAPTGDSSAAFNGTSSKIDTSYAPTGLTAITLEGWCSFEGLGQIGFARIIANSTPASDHGGFALVNSQGNPQVYFGTGSSFVEVAPAGTFLLDGSTWHHIVATWDGTTITLYADGQQVATGAWAGPLQPGAVPVSIGYDPASPGNYFTGNIAEVAVYPYALTAAQVQANYAASTQVTGNYILTAFVLKQEQVSITSSDGSLPIPQAFEDFAADAASYVYPVLAADQQRTDNAVARFSTQFLLGSTCPWGFVGGLGQAYEACSWVPVQRNYKLATGYVEFNPVLAAAWKFEFTSLQPEPFDWDAPRAHQISTFPGQVIPSTVAITPTAPAVLDPGLTVGQAVASTISYSDTPAPSPDAPAGVPLATEGLYAVEPDAVGRLAAAGGSLYSLQPWQPGHVIPSWPSTQQHNYRQVEVSAPTRVAYFVALRQIRMFRLDYAAADDTEMYLDILADLHNVDPSTLVAGGWHLVPGQGLATPAGLSGAAQVESLVLNSLHGVTGVQFATGQSDSIQLLSDPDFSDPQIAAWAAAGDALPLTESTVNSQLGTMVTVQRFGSLPGGGGGSTWADLMAQAPTWASLMAANPQWFSFGLVSNGQAIGGIAYAGPPLATAKAGRLAAAARVFSPKALTAPLYLQLLDGATGAVISEASATVSGGTVTEWITGFTPGSAEVSTNTWAEVAALYPTWSAIAAAPITWSSIDTSVLPLGATVSVRLIQKDATADTWDVDNISVFMDALVWEFSNDGGATWYPAYDIRNNPRGVMLFPPPALGSGNQLKWRATAYRPGVFVSSIAIRPWYVVWPQGIVPRPAGIGHGPNVSPLDGYAPVEDDPRWQLGATLVPDAWYFAVRQALGVAPQASNFPGPPLPPPNADLGNALVYQPPPGGPGPVQTWSDIYTDTYTDEYAPADGGDIYTDTYCDIFGVDNEPSTGTTRSGSAAFAAAVTMTVSGTTVPAPAPLLGGNFGAVASSSSLITNWIAATGLPSPVRRIDLGNQIPASLAASLAAGDAGVRKVLFTFQPDATTTPAQLATFLASCVAGGLQAAVSIWPNPDQTFATPAAYFAVAQAYIPVVQLAGYEHVFIISNASVVTGALTTWYPGDDLVDVISPTFFCQGAAPGSGSPTLAVASTFANAHGKPLGLAGIGVNITTFTTAQGDAFLSYVASLLASRKAAGNVNSDVIYLATGNFSIIGQQTLIGDYQNIAAVLGEGPPVVTGSGLVGATVRASVYGVPTQTQAMSQFDSFVGRPMATTIEKIYLNTTVGVWPATVDATYQNIISAGGKLLVCFQPAQSSTGTYADGTATTVGGITCGQEKASLAAAIALFQAAGATFDVVLWQECNGNKGFSTGTGSGSYDAMLAYYGPTVTGAGATLVYCPSVAATQDPVAMLPNQRGVGKVLADLYASGYASGKRLDAVAGIADSFGVPFGIAEWNMAAASSTPTITDFNNYVAYLISFFGARRAAGKAIGDVILWMGSSTGNVLNVVASASDPKVPGIDQVYDALTSAPPPQTGSLVGATCQTGLPTSAQATKQQAADFFDGCFNTGGSTEYKFAYSMQKVYYGANTNGSGKFPTAFVDGSSRDISALVNGGAQIWLCYMPNVVTSTTERNNFAASVQWWINNHPQGSDGVRVIIWQEPQNSGFGFTQTTYQQTFSYYAPALQALTDPRGKHAKVVYDGAGHALPNGTCVSWLQAILNAGTPPDEVAVDFYGSLWESMTNGGTTNLDPVAPLRTLALSHNLPFGFGEIGRAEGTNAYTPSLFPAYVNYLKSCMLACPSNLRTAVGWYNGDTNLPNQNTMTAGSDMLGPLEGLWHALTGQ